jgi:PPM family protein phosphatase
MDQRVHKILQCELEEWLASNQPSDGSQALAGTDIVLGTAKNDRTENQDRAIFVTFTSPLTERCFSLLAVLDGIGGMVDGGHCADLCISTLITEMLGIRRTHNRFVLIQAINAANREVWKHYNGRGGTTFAGVYFDHDGAKSINIGDSHVYEHRQMLGFVQKSTDDRLGAQFAKIKGLENVALDPTIARRLAQYIGMQEPPKPHVSALGKDLFQGDDVLFLLTTDGVHIQNDFGEQLKDKSPKTILKKLIEHSGGPDSDNATAICARARALQTTSESNENPFEHLRVWTANGVFNFLLPIEGNQVPPAVFERRERRRERTYPRAKRTSHETIKPHQGSFDKAIPNEPTTSKKSENDNRNEGGAGKPHVTIRQLNFESNFDEPTE